MRQTYLYRLFLHSKAAFILVVAFIALYAFFFSKKMDMLVFPHNSMFAEKPADLNDTAYTYAIKLNGELVRITGFPYWKKDFIESSLIRYASYIEHNNMTYLHQYFASKNTIPQSWQERLVPSERAATAYLPWLVNYTGNAMKKSSKMELYRYNFVYDNGNALLKDSVLLFSQKIITP